MDKIHSISDDIVRLIQNEFENGSRWLAYNTKSYFVEREDLAFFKKQDEAKEYCEANISDYDCYTAIQIGSVKAAILEMQYAECLEKKIRQAYAWNDNLKLKNIDYMNQKNLDYLKDSLKYLGFGEKLYPELEKNIQQKYSEFVLRHEAEYNNQKIESSLHFRRGDQNEMYFFNKYEATLKNENNPSQERTQNFYIGNKNSGFTVKEAFNLLNGRAVNKDLVNNNGTQYNAWVQLDLKESQNNSFKVKQYHQNYGFNLVKTLFNYNIKELAVESQKEFLVKSLQKGNIQSATVQKDGGPQKIFIEADPQFKTLNFYDEKMKRIPREAVDQFKSLQVSEVKEVKQEQKQDSKDVAKENKQKQASEKKSLLPKKPKQPQLLEKKRVSDKKGLHL